MSSVGCKCRIFAERKAIMTHPSPASKKEPEIIAKLKQIVTTTQRVYA